MNIDNLIHAFSTDGRYISCSAESGDAALGPLRDLPGTWRGTGSGWNLVALPFQSSPKRGINYRVLMTQYNEELKFNLVDIGVPNRGIAQKNTDSANDDQFIVALDYQQKIDQVAAKDFPKSNKGLAAGLDIHHESGMWLHMLNHRTKSLDIARLASVPHGNAVLALGVSEQRQGMPVISRLNGLPIGVSQDLDFSDYLIPYRHFVDTPFLGTVNTDIIAFPGFNPIDMNAILNFANRGVPGLSTAHVTVLRVSTSLEDAGIVNIPFLKKQADATMMESTFWIQRIPAEGSQTLPRLRLQYSQIVMLEFFERPDGSGRLIRWPHVSICTLEKVHE